MGHVLINQKCEIYLNLAYWGSYYTCRSKHPLRLAFLGVWFDSSDAQQEHSAIQLNYKTWLLEIFWMEVWSAITHSYVFLSVNSKMIQ